MSHLNPLVIGQEETTLDKLRSILGQLEYKHQVEYWEKNGVPFNLSHISVPKVHPVTNEMFCEHEDGHY